MIEQIALKYVGVKFKHQGRRIETGLDCAGLVLCVLRDAGMVTADYTDYNANPCPQRLAEHLSKYADKVPVMECRSGDILLMLAEGEARHLAIHCGDRFTHANRNIGRVTQSRFTDKSKRCIVAAYRPRLINEQ
jgi:cell wall-associated NlpC family hydrolase